MFCSALFKAKAAEEERLAKERQEAEKRRIDKEKKEEAKRAVRNSRQRVRKLHADASVMLRRLVRADQLQEVCLQLDKPALDRIADELEAALKKEKSNAKGGVVETTGETPSVVLLHKEIRQCGFIPSEDLTVRLDGEEDAETSTVTPDNGSESADQEEERDLTPEEIAAAEAAEEAKRKAEEERLERQKKKKEEQRKEEEKRDQKRRQAEQKERKKAEMTQQKEVAKRAEAERKAEDARQKQLAANEEARRLAEEEEAEAKELREAEAYSRAFEADRISKLSQLENNTADVRLESLIGQSLDDPALRGALRRLRGAVDEPEKPVKEKASLWFYARARVRIL